MDIRLIEFICEDLGIQNYKVNPDETVDVDGNVDISRMDLDKLPLKFGKVSGHFFCTNNKLTGLEGAPRYVGRDFCCNYNKITSLEGAPIEVGGDFSCYNNKLTSLEGAPTYFVWNFLCGANRLITLKGAPLSIGNDFYCQNNKLTSLEGAPIEVGGDFDCDSNNIISLEGAPIEVGGDFVCINNPISKLYELFPNYDSFIESLDYNYLRGTSIIKFRFEEALEELNMEIPKEIKGWTWI
jgi:hypothetical protein